MLTPLHTQEFRDSAIAPQLAALNFRSTDDNDFIRQWIHWKPHDRWKRCPFDSGWFCPTLDPHTGDPRPWGPFKPDTPLLDRTKGKLRKYEHPAGYETLAILLNVDAETWHQIAVRHQVPITPLLLRLQDRDPHPHFWDWVWTHNLPIVICEGAKKAAALLSAGYVAIALPGVWNGRKKRNGNTPERLIPDLQHFATPGRAITFCFDHDPKLKTRQHVSHALIRTGKLFEQAGCTVQVIRLPGPEKGVDDFIVARGAAALDQLALDAIVLSVYERERQHGLWGHRLTFPIALRLNQPYLLQSRSPLDAASESADIGLPTSGVIALKSDMGTGKTELLKHIKTRNPNARILNLGHRVALLRNLSARIGTAFYSEHGFGMWREQWLSLTADSLHKLKTEGNTYDYIFLDECEQFIQHLLCSSTCKEHRSLILQALRHFIFSAQCIVMSDAHLSDLSLQFIQAMRPDPAETPFVIQNDFKNGDRAVYWYESTHRFSIVQTIKGALFQNDRPIVACDGLEFSKDLQEALHSLFPDKQIVCINSENSNEAWARSLLENINQPGVLEGIDCLIYSPSVNTGVSIDTPHFTHVFGVFTGGALAGTDCLQALNRYRPKVEWHVWVGAQPIGGYRPTRAERIQQQKLTENDVGGFLLKITPGTGEKTVQDAFAWKAWAAIQARRNESLNNLRDDVRYLIDHQGHHLVSVSVEADADTKLELSDARTINQLVKQQGILSADRISATQARHLEAKEHPTLQDWYQLERYRLERDWGREVDEALIELDNGGRTIRQFAALDALLEAPSETTIVHGKRIFFPPAPIAHKDLSDRQQYHALDWRNYSVAWSMRRELGLHTLIDPNRTFRNDDADLLALLEQVQRNALIIKDFLGITIKRNATPIQALQQLFEQVGLKLVCDRRQGARGEQQRIYRLDPESWSVAQSVLEYRRTKRESQSQAGSEAHSSSVVTSPPLAIDPIEGGDVTTDESRSDEERNQWHSILNQREADRCRRLWAQWTAVERSQRVAQVPERFRRWVLETVRQPLFQPGAIVRCIGKSGEWIVRGVGTVSATIVAVACPALEWVVDLSELEWVESGEGDFNRQSRLSP
jgi:hypothetical protein